MRRTFSQPERPTLTSRSLQSITRPFQKRFREVFGNTRILIFYLSTKAWEEKSLPKSHLGWFFLVFGEGKTTKENMSIFWFIWPRRLGPSMSKHRLRKKNRKKSRYFRLPPNLAHRKLIALANYVPSSSPLRVLSFTQRFFKNVEKWRCVVRSIWDVFA